MDVYGCLSSVKVRAQNENVKCILLYMQSPRHSDVTQHRSWNLKLPRQGLRLSLAPRTTCLRRSSVVEHMMRELTLGPLDVFSTRWFATEDPFTLLKITLQWWRFGFRTGNMTATCFSSKRPSILAYLKLQTAFWDWTFQPDSGQWMSYRVWMVLTWEILIQCGQICRVAGIRCLRRKLDCLHQGRTLIVGMGQSFKVTATQLRSAAVQNCEKTVSSICRRINNVYLLLYVH